MRVSGTAPSGASGGAVLSAAIIGTILRASQRLKQIRFGNTGNQRLICYNAGEMPRSITARGIGGPSFAKIARFYLQQVRSNPRTHFTGTVAKNGMELESIALPRVISSSQRVIIKKITVSSKQKLNLEVLLFSRAAGPTSDLDTDSLVYRGGFDLTTYGVPTSKTKDWVATAAVPNPVTGGRWLYLSSIRDWICYALDPGDNTASGIYFYRYDLLADLWTQLTAPPGGHTHAATSPANRPLVRIGGPDRLACAWGLRQVGILVLADRIAIYDVAGDSWTESSVPAVPGWDANTTAIWSLCVDGTDTIWAWGNGQEGGVNRYRVLKYTISTDSWDYSASNAPVYLTTCAWYASGYVYGGMVSDLCRYDTVLDAYSSITLPTAPGSYSREYAYGGAGGFGYLPIFGFQLGPGGTGNAGAKLGYTNLNSAPTVSHTLQKWDFSHLSLYDDQDLVRGAGFSSDLEQAIITLESNLPDSYHPTPYVYLSSAFYQMGSARLSIPYIDLDGSRKLHVAVRNLSPTAKAAGSAGEVVVAVDYEWAA